MITFEIEEQVKELTNDCEVKFNNINMKLSKIKNENYDKFKEFKYEYDYKLKNMIEKYDYKYNLLEKKVYNLLIIFVIITLYNAYNSILYRII